MRPATESDIPAVAKSAKALLSRLLEVRPFAALTGEPAHSLEITPFFCSLFTLGRITKAQ